ncbi:MAG: precorrin-3B C(17)-methyltransferase [Oscillospiraceae bacterium]|nr:precorrin-3B C(17)-methyltransferase [Oscillospiraceae bacterium]
MRLYVVGFGAGNYEGMTIAAQKAIEDSGLITGYTVYTELIREHFPDKEYYSTPMRQERERVEYALSQAETRNTALVCSGDCSVYAMAGLAYELWEKYPAAEIIPVAGVTAALSGGAVLGAPITNDFAVISLSDILTPKEKIEKRLECAAMADMCVALYNPSSKKRADHLKWACGIMLRYKSPATVCGYVKNIGRDGEESRVLTLAELSQIDADMFTTIFIGCAETKIINGKMVTPRGYRLE